MSVVVEQRIQIPASLMRKKGQKRKMSHRDISSMIHLQKNPNLLKKRRLATASSLPPREDLVSMILVKWHLVELLKVSRLMLIILCHDRYSESEQVFANHTPIRVDDEMGTHFMSFLAYYKMIYQDACLVQREGGGTSSSSSVYRKTHVIRLLRACFLMAFMHDPRIERFVMAHHTIHAEYLQTRAPDPSRVLSFFVAARDVVAAFLFREEIQICEMLEETTRLWVELGMI